MRQRLELAGAAGAPFAKGFVPHGFFQNAGKKLRLCLKTFGRQSGGFANLLNGGKIDVGGQILFAGIRQQIVADVMPEIRAERALRARGRKKFVGGQAIINREQSSARQTSGGLTPPVFGGGRSLDGVVVGQNGLQF